MDGQNLAEMAIMGSKPMLEKALANVPANLIPKGITGGDTKVVWNRDNADEVSTARTLFEELKKKGFAAFAVKKDGSGEKGVQIFQWDANLEGLIMTPPLRGGC